MARVGGTRIGLNAEALASGPPSGAPVYRLVGWAGTGEGNGEEAALGVEGTGDTPDLTGVPRRDRQYMFRPAQTSAFGPPPGPLENLILQPPVPSPGRWRTIRGRARRSPTSAAQDSRLGSDPRSAYWIQPLDEATWNAIAAKIEDVSYPGAGHGFAQAQFLAARTELVKELGRVGNVRGYLHALSSPFSDSALKSWTEAQTIADRIYREASKPTDSTALRWVQFTSIIGKILGPLTTSVSSTIANLMDVGVWLVRGIPGGRPAGNELRFGADELGAKLVDQAQQAQATHARRGDIIVSSVTQAT